MKKITFLLAGLSLLSTPGAQAAAQVTVHAPHNGAQAELSQVPDLAQLVSQPALQQSIDWRSSVIAERGASAVAQQQYQQTLGQLRAWRADSSGDRAAAIDEVLRQLIAIKVTGRQFTSIDPDWVRLHPADNRRLEGSYDLYLQTRSDSVLLLGALSGAGKVSWQPGRSVREYLADHPRLSGAERNFATVIAPSGATQQVPIAYWNHRHAEVEPGSIIWLGFSSWSLPGAYDDLNNRILSVLTHRIPD
ncbi:capsule biosynthesis GfcC family protein [Pantoea brenneri]|uniref:capsule biosynthesis GfcC family protein n=1 Tax=Pantoea brenneri TaxID=472694 RepID=UPI00289F5094|nr:capsule biosynthesis GfcC family protein [Pantoea brenneri]